MNVLFDQECTNCANLLTMQDRQRPVRNGYPYFSGCCIICAKKRQKTWKTEKNKNLYQQLKASEDKFTRHRQRLQRNHRKRTYGLFDEEYQVLFDAQGGLCACCGRPETTLDERSGFPRELAIDHDHKTNKIRCLLCWACNVSFGLLEEDPRLITLLLEFAEKQLVVVEAS